MPIALLFLISTARAGQPEDVSLSGMADQGGIAVVDKALLANVYKQVVGEVGAFTANKPVHPAAMLGQYGWEFGIDTTIAITTTWAQNGDPSPWGRVAEDETPQTFHWIPSVNARKGLPLSSEIGFNAGWIGETREGIVGGYGRVGVLNGYRPAPDVTLQLGYSGYVGNDELEVGVLDLGVTIGSTVGMGGIPGVRHGQFQPWFTFSSNRITAQPLLDSDVADQVGAVTFGGKAKAAADESVQPAIIQPTIGAGVQVISGNIHFRASGAWSWNGIPTITTGMGFTF